MLMGPVAAERGPARLPGGERVYAIGDIHGRRDLFEDIVEAIQADSEARPPAEVRLILLGDLIDRGPDSAALVRRCMGVARRTDRFTVLKGNHEAMMVEALRGNLLVLATWRRNGGDAALASWGVPERILADAPPKSVLREARRRVPRRVVAWLDALPLTARIGDYLFVHAGIRPGVPLDAQIDDDLLWIREPFIGSDADHGCVVVHGHSIMGDRAELRPNRIGIDTGAYDSGRLTAIGLEDDRQWLLTTGSPVSSHRPASAAAVA